jgi:hypothetical protein
MLFNGGRKAKDTISSMPHAVPYHGQMDLPVFRSFAHNSQRVLAAVHGLAVVVIECGFNLGVRAAKLGATAFADGQSGILFNYPQFALGHEYSLAPNACANEMAPVPKIEEEPNYGNPGDFASLLSSSFQVFCRSRRPSLKAADHFRLRKLSVRYPQAPVNPFLGASSVAEYLRQHTSPTDSIMVARSQKSTSTHIANSASGYVYTNSLVEDPLAINVAG